MRRRSVVRVFRWLDFLSTWSCLKNMSLSRSNKLESVFLERITFHCYPDRTKWALVGWILSMVQVNVLPHTCVWSYCLRTYSQFFFFFLFSNLRTMHPFLKELSHSQFHSILIFTGWLPLTYSFSTCLKQSTALPIQSTRPPPPSLSLLWQMLRNPVSLYPSLQHLCWLLKTDAVFLLRAISPVFYHIMLWRCVTTGLPKL